MNGTSLETHVSGASSKDNVNTEAHAGQNHNINTVNKTLKLWQSRNIWEQE
jgi:hypothetical protein